MIKIMAELVGILNLTPDSFSDGGEYADPAKAIDRAEELMEQGAAFVDIGAESTRPGAVALDPEEEWRRLEPVLSDLVPRYPDRFSLDTYHPETVQQAFMIGRVIVNDVTGMNNPDMVRVITGSGVRCIISHLRGTDIQAAHWGPLLDDVEPVAMDLLTKKKLLIKHGFEPNQVILDPGIGFGKTPELNRELLKFAKELPDHDVMIGYSRKRFLGENRMDLQVNLEAGRIAIENGAAYLRVHDVAGHRQLLY
jgi:dihydropteroate synthase